MEANVLGHFEAESLAAPSRTARGKSYLQPHSGITSSGDTTTRGEEHLAVALFNAYGVATPGLAVGVADRIRIVDYQVPLKARRADSVGNIDLLGIDDDGRICIIELKAGGSAEAPLRGVLEGLSYAAILNANLRALLGEFARRRLMASADVPRVLVLAPDVYWGRHQETLLAIRPLLTRIEHETRARVGLHSLGAVSVRHGLNGHRPVLLGTPSCRDLQLEAE